MMHLPQGSRLGLYYHKSKSRSRLANYGQYWYWSSLAPLGDESSHHLRCRLCKKARGRIGRWSQTLLNLEPTSRGSLSVFLFLFLALKGAAAHEDQGRCRETVTIPCQILCSRINVS